MHKIWLIIKREYLTRVRKKLFIITTLLLPLFYAGLIYGTGWLTEKSRKTLRVAVVDQSGYFTPEVLEKQNALDKTSVLLPASVGDTVNYEDAGYDGYMVVTPFEWKTGA